MIQDFVDRFMAARDQIKNEFTREHPGDYKDIVRVVIKAITVPDDYDYPDPERISVIDHGHYQGTLLFVIGAHGYQPRDYWYAMVDYGSCSASDTFQSIRDDCEDWSNPPNHRQIDDYMTLALHIVQRLKKMD